MNRLLYVGSVQGPDVDVEDAEAVKLGKDVDKEVEEAMVDQSKINM
jgi:hypothetical protein